MAKRTIIVQVDLYEGESSESLIRRFMRECKKEEVENQYRARMSYKTRSQRKKEKMEKSYARKRSLEQKKKKQEEKNRKFLLKRI
ncbi:MAG: 30S ribosomal protein S21 [Patescibacteria group bacterium]|nr:30S ribosomal protein S21 [Patescibacteria group bacterium]